MHEVSGPSRAFWSGNMDNLAFAYVKLHIPSSLPMLKRLQIWLKYMIIFHVGDCQNQQIIWDWKLSGRSCIHNRKRSGSSSLLSPEVHQRSLWPPLMTPHPVPKCSRWLYCWRDRWPISDQTEPSMCCNIFIIESWPCWTLTPDRIYYN